MQMWKGTGSEEVGVKRQEWQTVGVGVRLSSGLFLWLLHLFTAIPHRLQSKRSCQGCLRKRLT